MSGLEKTKRTFVTLAFVAIASMAAQTHGQEKRQVELKEVDTWAYQLQGLKPARIPADSFDVLVIDYSADGSDNKRYTRSQIDNLRHRPPFKDRIVLAYLSIGEAEDYRGYWRKEWAIEEPDSGSSPTPTGEVAQAAEPNSAEPVQQPAKKQNKHRLTQLAPQWLSGENPDWPGNFLVKYWDPAWQTLILGSPEAYLDAIIAAGFDGVYLDKVDSSDDWKKTRPTAEREMVEFVKRIADYARAKAPGFLIVPQNGENLIEHDDYLATIDGLGKEDLLYGGDTRRDGEPNPEQEIAESVRSLSRVTKSGKPVFAVEYLKVEAQILAAIDRLNSYGMIAFIAERELEADPVPLEERIDGYERSQAQPAR